ncbi:hypothetical protein CIPAW_13G122100 [Carya illinoinensis]|uniref:Uncharacterized protein n=1 Tax=Carya illinoinensis TaxID=32201 RepID=A0A8T1NQY0_CARIL|nr:hypothetical protein CIPAW_13G122100 [Carya illinoinensis]
MLVSLHLSLSFVSLFSLFICISHFLDSPAHLFVSLLSLLFAASMLHHTGWCYHIASEYMIMFSWVAINIVIYGCRSCKFET